MVLEGNTIPTPTLQEQTTTSQGWSVDDLYKAILSGIFTVAVIGGIFTVVYKKGSAIYNKCFNGSKESHSGNNPYDDYHNCEILSENKAMSILSNALNTAEDVATFSNAFAAKGADIFSNALDTAEAITSLTGDRYALTESDPL